MSILGSPVALRASDGFGVPARRAPRLRLGGRARTALRALHLVFSGGWLGLATAMLTLGLSAALAADAAFAAACYTMMDRFGIAIPIFAIGSVLTGAGLSLATRWGFVRYWWVLVKTVLALATIVTAVGLAGAWREQVVGRYGEIADVPAWLLVGSSGMHVVMLGVATVISVGKPWGRTRRDQSRARRGTGPNSPLRNSR
jgi:hypothetical protein